MNIGIDFDNTIACYSDAFYKAALEKNLIPSSIKKDKTSIRDFLRSNGKEKEWTHLQGYIYGSRMDLAYPFDHIETSLKKWKEEGHSLFLISHKTLHPYEGPSYNLHEAAKKWIEQRSFFLYFSALFFETTLEKKLKRISQIPIDLFIDDLPELLLHENFPAKTKKLLFDPEMRYTNCTTLDKIHSWKEAIPFLQSC